MPHILHQLTKHVHWFTPDSDTDRPILGLISGEHSSLMVDAGASIKHTNEFLEAVKRAGLARPDYCVLTHWHWDHSFGAETLETLLIAHRRTAELLKIQSGYSFSDKALDERVEQGLEIAFCRDYMKLEMNEKERLALKLCTPDIVFDDGLTIDLGGVSCELEHVAGDHAEDSVVVYIPEDNTLFLGDCTYHCLHSRSPYYSSEVTLKLVSKLLKYDVNYALESHTDDVYIKESFERYLNVLEVFATLVQDINDRESLIREARQRLTNLAREAIEEYSMMFLNGLRAGVL